MPGLRLIFSGRSNMQKADKGFWDYVDRWRGIFREERAVRWEKNWLENDYCCDCRFCCGPQDSATPFPMALLPHQIAPENADNFHMLDASTAFLGKDGCLSDTPRGCRLALDQKPIACGLFPVVLVNGGLYLYQNCPAVVFTPLVRFLDIAKKAAATLLELPLEDLRHVSIWLNEDSLARSYIDLRIRLFGHTCKKAVLE